MAYKLKTDNYEKKPSAEMRKLWVEAWGMPLADIKPTRITFSLHVKELLAGPNGTELRRKLAEWRKAREAARKARREAASQHA